MSTTLATIRDAVMIGGYRQDLHVRSGPVPQHGRKIDVLLHRVNVARACKIIDSLVEAEDEGIGMGLDDGPIFYEVKVPFLTLPSSLGAQCAAVNDAIAAEFDRHGLPPVAGLRSIITTSAMLAGDADAGLAYLLGWVGIDTGEDD